MAGTTQQGKGQTGDPKRKDQTGKPGKTGKGQNGGGRRPVGSKVVKRIQELAAEGMTRNAIARELGISPSTVSRHVPPGTFDRSSTMAATEAVVADAKTRRAGISTGLLDDVVKLRGMMFEQVERVHFSVTNGEERYMAGLVPGEMKDLAIALGVLLDKHLALVKHDSDDRDLPAVDKWLEAMGVGVAHALS